MIKKNFIKKILVSSVASLLVLQIVYFTVEPTLSTAATATDSVVVTLNVTSGVTISDGANATMAPNIGISANKSVGNSSWSVATNSVTGYTLAVKASTTPALKNGSTDEFVDYTATVPTTPETWSVSSGNKEFGYSAYGTDVADGTWGTHEGCGDTGTGIVATGSLYRGFTTSDVTIASRSGVTPTSGITTNICFAAEQNGVYAASGSYTATITATATAA